MSAEKNPKRSLGQVVFMWVYTAVWIVALCWTWINYDRMVLWEKVVVDFLLFATTPILADLFISRRRLKDQR